MSRLLILGPLPDAEQVQAVEDHLQQLGVSGATAAAWNRGGAEEEVVFPSLLDVLRLRDHAAAKEGAAPTIDPEISRFTNLPGAPDCVWIPVDFSPPRFPLLPAKIEPVFLGSAPRLVAELELLAELSGMVLGERREEEPGGEEGSPSPLREALERLHAAAVCSVERRVPLRGFPPAGERSRPTPSPQGGATP